MEGYAMSKERLTLDTMLSAVDHFTQRWSKGIESNKAGRLLRYLLIRLYNESQGRMMNATITLAQTTLAKKLNISRPWIIELGKRLQEQGWLEHESPRIEYGLSGSTVWTIGRQMKRLLVMLNKSHQRPKQTQALSPVKKTQHFSPVYTDVKSISLPIMALKAIPLLQTWINRGGNQ